jgi:hypothetical protein
MEITAVFEGFYLYKKVVSESGKSISACTLEAFKRTVYGENTKKILP